MTIAAVQSQAIRATIIALLIFTLSFVLVVYTLTHEAGHAAVGMLFGQTLTSLRVNFLNLNAHVGLAGDLTPAQRAWQSIAGAGLPLAIWLIFISGAPRRSSLLVEMLKCIASIAVLSTLLAWMILPVLYRFEQAPAGDVSNFLVVSKVEPLLLSFCALVLYIAGWSWFFHKIQGVRSEIALFSTANRDIASAGLRLPLSVMVSLLVTSSLLLIVLGATLNPLAPPQDFRAVARLDLSARAYSAESLTQFSLANPATVELYLTVQKIDTTYFDLRLIGPEGFNAVILHGEDYTTVQDLVTWRQNLKPGDYRLVVTSAATPGIVSIYLKDH